MNLAIATTVATEETAAIPRTNLAATMPSQATETMRCTATRNLYVEGDTRRPRPPFLRERSGWFTSHPPGSVPSAPDPLRTPTSRSRVSARRASGRVRHHSYARPRRGTPSARVSAVVSRDPAYVG
ncbi:hypothetical protein GCM10023317_77270 [Actinopolymorpha pittospori]